MDQLIISAEYLPHGQKREKPSHQGRRRCRCEAVHPPHPDVVRSGQNRRQSHHAGHQRELQEYGCYCIACTYDHKAHPLSLHSPSPKALDTTPGIIKSNSRLIIFPVTELAGDRLAWTCPHHDRFKQGKKKTMRLPDLMIHVQLILKVPFFLYCKAGLKLITVHKQYHDQPNTLPCRSNHHRTI